MLDGYRYCIRHRSFAASPSISLCSQQQVNLSPPYYSCTRCPNTPTLSSIHQRCGPMLRHHNAHVHMCLPEPMLMLGPSPVICKPRNILNANYYLHMNSRLVTCRSIEKNNPAPNGYHVKNALHRQLSVRGWISNCFANKGYILQNPHRFLDSNLFIDLQSGRFTFRRI